MKPLFFSILPQTRRMLFCMSAFAAILFVSGCSAPANTPVSRQEFVLNTTATITLYAVDGADTQKQLETQAETILTNAFDRCRDYESIFSRTLPGSELYKLNHREGTTPQADGTETAVVSEDLAACIRLAEQYSELSNGAFDLTVAPLSDLWNFSAANPHVPDPDALKAALLSVNYKNVHITGNTVTFSSPDTQIDLGAVAKGYIADRLSEELKAQNVTSAILNLGGNILCIGARPSCDSFTVGIQDPFDASNGTYLKLSVHDLSVVTSGIYERCFTENGITYHHLLNPATGYPYDNGLASVTILHASSAEADVLSTTCFALGIEQGLDLINSISDCEAIFISTDGTISYSDGAESYLAK